MVMQVRSPVCRFVSPQARRAKQLTRLDLSVIEAQEKMGFAVAKAAADAGAQVTLIAGPVTLATPPRVTRIDVESTQQMYDATLAEIESADIYIGAAAIADYRPDKNLSA